MTRQSLNRRTEEALVRLYDRPVFYIQHGKIVPADLAAWAQKVDLTQLHPEVDMPPTVWAQKIDAARTRLETTFPAIGRIDLTHHPTHHWVGTGWLVDENIIVTNRHVAAEFALRSGVDFAFSLSPEGEKIEAHLDFTREHEGASPRRFRITRVLYVEDEGWDAPDLAFLQVERENVDGDRLTAPVVLAEADPEPGTLVAAVGYAGWDGNRNDPIEMNRIFDGIYGVKRLHPGMITEVLPKILKHDCATLGGNSGSTLVDFATGQAVGLHFAGAFLDSNYAVKSTVLHDRLGKVRKATRRSFGAAL